MRMPLRFSARTSRRPCVPPIVAASVRGSRPNAPYGSLGGSTASTPSDRSRSSAWSRRMKPSSGLGSSSRQTGRRSSPRAASEAASAARAARRRLGARGIAAQANVPPPMGGYLKRLLASSAAYQAASLLSAALGADHAAALHAPPHAGGLRLRRDAADVRHLRIDPACASGSARRSCASGSTTTIPTRRAELIRTSIGFVAITTTVVAAAGVALAGPLSELLLGTEDATLMAYGVLGPVGVHEPRAGLRAAARGGAPPCLRHRRRHKRPGDGGADDRAGRRLRRGRARLRRWATTRRPRSCCSGSGRRSASAPCLRCRASSLRCCASARRPFLQMPTVFLAQRRRPRLHPALAVRGGGGSLRRRGEALDGGHRARARIPGRVAAAGLQHQRRRRGQAPLRVRDDRSTCLSPAPASRRSRCSAAGLCGCLPTRSTSLRTRRCRGWRSAGRSTASTSCSSRSPAARR